VILNDCTLTAVIRFLCVASTASCGSLHLLREVINSQHIKRRTYVFSHPEMPTRKPQDPGIFSGDHFTPVETDEEPAHENGRRTGERSIAGFDASATRTGAPMAGVLSRLDMSHQSSLSGHSPDLRASCRKDWLFVRKEDSMESRRSSVMIRDGTTEEKERQHDD
jgi:hypothetical protein